MIRGPQSRMAPNPRRRTTRSPPMRKVSGAEVSGDRRVDLEAPFHAGEVDPLDHCVRALAHGPEDDRRDPGSREKGRVGPEGNADDLGISDVAEDELDYLLSPVDLEGLA